jgi:outer membrane protein assembly factor BamB
MNPNRFSFLLALVLTASSASGDWPQWRGPDRTGYVQTANLISSLPSQGVTPLWKFGAFPGGNNGGWSSPVISGGRVFVFAHTKTKNPAADPVKAKYPWLAPEKRVGMTDQEYAEYEVNRRDENELQAKAFRFDERLVCLDLMTGKVIWDKSDSSKYTRFTHSGTPCVADGRVFVLGAQRTARCYDAATGELLWSRPLPGDFRDEYFSSSFVVDGDTALVTCGPLVALSAQDGQLRWHGDTPLDYPSQSSPAVWHAAEESVAIANTSGGRTQAYRISDGAKLWEINTGASQSTPIIAGDLLLAYGSSRKNGLKAYQLAADAPQKEPELAWQFQGAADSGSTPVVRGDAVFVQGEKRLAKVRLSDGDRLWQTTMKASNPRYTSLIAAGDQVFFGWEGLLSVKADGDDFQQLYEAKVDSDGVLIETDDLRAKLKLSEVEAETDGLEKSEKLWQQRAVKSGPLGCTTPAVSDGRMVIRLRDAVVCFDLRL